MAVKAVDRRTFLQRVAVATGGAALWPFADVVAGTAQASPGFRTLGPVEDLRDGKVRLHLPEGFEYRSFHDTDGPPVVLGDGTVLPGRHDGMAAFPGPEGKVWLVRNHEVNGPVPAFGPGGPYDARTGGGTTTTLVDGRGNVHDSFTSLNGTQMNCMGGEMPWGSWITCEETVNGPDVGADFTGASNTSLERPHGYIFEVPAGGQSDRQPIRSAGRFAHEAVAFDPAGGVLYMTEDNFGFPSGFYRYIPPENPMKSGSLADGGRLQMLAVVGTTERQSSRRPASARHVQRDVGRHRAARRRLSLHPRSAGADDQQRRDQLRRQSGPCARRRLVLADRRLCLRPRRRLLLLHAGRRPRRDELRPDRRRLRQRQRADLGVPHRHANPPADLRVAGNRCTRSPGQRHGP